MGGMSCKYRRDTRDTRLQNIDEAVNSCWASVMIVCHYFKLHAVQMTKSATLSAGERQEDSQRRGERADDVDLKAYERAGGCGKISRRAERKLTCASRLPSAAEGHHLAEIYCTITWGTAVIVCKIKARRWNQIVKTETYSDSFYCKAAASKWFLLLLLLHYGPL